MTDVRGQGDLERPRPSEGRATTGPPPEGTLELFPLPVLFAHVLSHRLTGSLILRGEKGDDVVVFGHGAPMRVRTAKMIAPLGEMLVRLGVLADVDLQSALFRAQTAKAPLGKQLVSDSLIDKRVLLRALREQILVRLRSLAATPESTPYEFHSNADVLEEPVATNAVTCDALAGILALARAWPDRRRMDELLEPISSQRARLHPNAAVDRFELDDGERAIVARLRSASNLTYRDLYHSSVAPERAIRALVYALVLTRHADDGSHAEPLDVVAPLDPIESMRDSSLNLGVDPLRTSTAINALGAADDHREAENLLRAGSIDAAEILATRAVERDPRPEYKALLGVVIAGHGGRSNYKRGLAMLDAAIAEAKTNDRALVYRATVLRDAGRFDAAIRDWRAALAANPANAEAKLALRRAESRSDTVNPMRRSSAHVPSGRASRSSTPPALRGSSGWWILGALVVSTIFLLAVLLHLKR